MIVYRLTTVQFRNDLSGRGAEIAGGRWNSKGVAMLYTAESRALCALEIAVHTQLNVVPVNYIMVSIKIPDNAEQKQILEKDLPPNWRSFPQSRYTQTLGDIFFREGKYLVLKVPSAIVEGDFNMLVNPQHKDFHKVKVIEAKPFEFDQRLFIKQANA